MRQNALYNVPVTHHFHPFFRIQDRFNGRIWKMKNKMFTLMVSPFSAFWHVAVTVFPVLLRLSRIILEMRLLKMFVEKHNNSEIP